MSGSENNRDSFSRAWQDRFSDVEMTPPESVWSGIDRSLANQEVIRYKKKATVYKWAAIVAILLMATISVPSLFDQTLPINPEKSDLQESPDRPNVQDDNVPEEALSSVIILPDDERQETSKKQEIKLRSSSIDANSGSNSSITKVMDENTTYPLMAYLQPSEPKFEPIDPSAILASVEGPRPIYIFKKYNPNKGYERKEEGKFWAGVGVGSGSFDPNYQINNSNPIANAMITSRQGAFVNTSSGRTSVPEIEESMNTGMNYQVGLNLGMRVVDRWTIEGGVQYAVAQTTTNTNISLENRFFTQSVALTSESASIEAVASVADQQEIIEYREEDISLDNTFQFASFPLKAGFIVFDNKMSLRINAGMIANLYLGNSLTDKTQAVASLDIAPGNNSPYRDLSFSGITGVSVGYEVMNLSLIHI